MSDIKIHFLEGSRKGESIIVKSKDPITFGRDINCNIVLKDSGNSSISRYHAKLINGVLTDTSTNGTIVDGKVIHQTNIKIKGGEKIQFSSRGDIVQFIIESTDSKSKYDDYSQVPSYTKIIPASNSGFMRELMTQPFMIPGLITVITGILLFGIMLAGADTQNIIYIYLYELLLGAYFGSMMIFFIIGISKLVIPLWVPISSAFIIALVFFIDLPFYLLTIVFRTDTILILMDSNNFLAKFIGHFVGAGLIEELFKSIPVWIACILAPRLKRLHIGGFINGKITPTLTVLIGASAAIGFIIIETLLEYVPKIQNELGYEWGLMLLIPRFITGIAGHVAWSGIFAYFIGLKYYYKNGTFLYPLIGWIIASTLHGLWNASIGSYLAIVVALVSFVSFTAYLFKAKNTFVLK